MNETISKQTVRYVKNGAGGKWWRSAKDLGQVHLGWNIIPHPLLLDTNINAIENILLDHFSTQGAAKRDLKQLKDLLDTPSQHIWITFEDGYMWWCTVFDGPIMNEVGENEANGNFILNCNSQWSNYSLNGNLLAIADLPGRVTSTSGFRGTVCEPKAADDILRIIRGEQDPDAIAAAEARAKYEFAVMKTITRLTPQDFEQLIDLILVRTGWARISTLGKTREGIDIEAKNLAADEIAFVQVKSAATQAVLDDYVARFNARREYYARMIFAVHTPHGKLSLPNELPIQVWTGDQLARLVVRLGLGEWVETRLA